MKQYPSPGLRLRGESDASGVCEFCCTPFTGRGKGARFCSDKCTVAAKRARQAKRRPA